MIYDLITKIQRKRSMIVFTEYQDFDDIFKDILNNIKNSYFYIINGSDKVQQIITLNNVNKFIVNDVIQDSNGSFIEPLDLQGVHLVGISLSFPPWLLMSGCNKSGKNCKSSGKNEQHCILISRSFHGRFTVVSRSFRGRFTVVSRSIHGRFTVKTITFRLALQNW